MEYFGTRLLYSIILCNLEWENVDKMNESEREMKQGLCLARRFHIYIVQVNKYCLRNAKIPLCLHDIYQRK